jgi:K(+)-stimulated pyrophosphate-energized sodium pump
VGDTVGDPFKDTSSVAMNPVIKFTTLFGLLAVELGVNLANQAGTAGSPDYKWNHLIAAACFLVSAFFVWRSFYRMQIGGTGAHVANTAIAPSVAGQPEGHVR